MCIITTLDTTFIPFDSILLHSFPVQPTPVYLSVLHTVPFCPILFHFILFHSVPILCYFILLSYVMDDACFVCNIHYISSIISN